jgi:NTP pyrophosphatase (non-canonical NTP hydrolase)
MNHAPPADDPAPLDAHRQLLAEILAGLEHPPLGAGVALAEECGEVAKHLLDHHAYGRPLERDALGSELADVFVCICEIATLHRIDLDAAVAAKEESLRKLAPEWRVTLAEALKRAR